MLGFSPVNLMLKFELYDGVPTAVDSSAIAIWNCCERSFRRINPRKRSHSLIDRNPWKVETCIRQTTCLVMLFGELKIVRRGMIKRRKKAGGLKTGLRCQKRTCKLSEMFGVIWLHFRTQWLQVVVSFLNGSSNTTDPCPAKCCWVS